MTNLHTTSMNIGQPLSKKEMKAVKGGDMECSWTITWADGSVTEGGGLCGGGTYDCWKWSHREAAVLSTADGGSYKHHGCTAV